MKTFLSILLFTLANSTYANMDLINGLPVGDQFKGVGMFNMGCTITKVGARHFITAAHCVNGRERSLSLNFKDYRGSVKVKSAHIHPSWSADCAIRRCDGTEVGSSRMTPGRADVAFFNVQEETPAIPVVPVNFKALDVGTEVAMVGGGCTRNVEPGGRASMRYAITHLVSYEHLIHQHSLYKDIAEVTGKADWVTPGYGVSSSNASLCPGDSGGPMLTKVENGEWNIVGIAADYTFDGPYRDGDVTVTNLHTRLDDESFHNIGQWIRSVWAE